MPRDWATAADYIAIMPYRAPGTPVRSQHALPCDSLLLVLDGVYHWRATDGERRATAGDIVYHAPGFERETWNDPARPLDCLHLLFHWHDRPPGIPDWTEDAQGRVGMLAAWLLEDVADTATATERVRDYRLAGLLGEYLRLWTPPLDALVTRCRDHMRDHLDRPLNVSDLADLVGLSRAHFTRRYTELAGITPKADLQRLRLEETRHLLLTTALPLRAIALRVGFTDASHLGRRFLRHFGMTAQQARLATVAYPLPGGAGDTPD